ncbi:MAG: ribonuclease domain-containing protein [Eubacteriales bacterium]
MGTNGADAYLYFYKKLPEYYVTKEFAEINRWQNKKGNLNEVLPGKMIGGDIYRNEDRKLPGSSGRIWYEADINYAGGFRGAHRILYSNDGLIFVSYDHYKTFYEITG